MSLYSWKQLARWSIDYSCLKDPQKAEGHNYLNQDWKEFCDYIVEEYGGLVVNEDIDDAKAKDMIKRCSKHPNATYLK
mgnify:CR=1 FL=1